MWKKTRIKKEHKPGHAYNTVYDTGNNCGLFVILKKAKLQLCWDEWIWKELLFIQQICCMELLIVRFPFLYNPPHRTGSGCCSVPAVLKMFSEDYNSTGAFLFFAFYTRICTSGQKRLFSYCHHWSSTEFIIYFCLWPSVLLAAVLSASPSWAFYSSAASEYK